MTGPTYTLGVDNVQGMAALSQMQTKMKQVGDTARSELGQKLKTVFTVAAIEQAVQRTGEWAREIENASKTLGVAGESLQALQLIASKTGLSSDAVTGMFDNISKAGQGALAGNNELIMSFQQLGVSLMDIQTMTKTQLFSKVLTNIPKNVQASGNQSRVNVANVTGNTPEQVIDTVKSQVGEQGFEGYTNSGLKAGTILDHDQTASIADSYSQFLNDLKETGIKLMPIGKLLLNVVNIIADAINGIGDLVSGAIDLMKGNVKEGLKKIGGVVLGAAFGLFKMVTGILDFAAKAGFNVAGKVLHSKYLKDKADHYDETSMTAGVETLEKNAMDVYGLNKEVMNHGEAIGTIVGVVGTGGSGAATASSGLLKVATGLEKVGLGGKVSSKLIDMGLDAADASKTGGLAGSIGRSAGEAVNWTGNKILDSNLQKSFRKVIKDEQSTGGAGFELSPDGDISAQSAIDKYKLGVAKLSNVTKGFAKWGARAASVAVPALAIKNAIDRNEKQPPKYPGETTPIVPRNYFLTELGASKNSGIAMGGTFGSGFQSRLIMLNQKQVDYLQQITRYMSYNPTINNPGNNNNNANTQPSGL